MEKDFNITGKFIFRNTTFNIIGKAIPLMVGVVSLPFIISGLGMEQFGILSIIWAALLSYFSFLDFGLGETITKFVAEFFNKERREDLLRRFFWNSLISAFIIGIVGALVVFLGASFLVNKILNISPQLKDVVEKSFFLLSFAVPFGTIVAISGGFLAGLHRFDLINFIKIPLNSLYFLIPVFCLLFGGGLFEIVLFLVIAQFFDALIYLIFCFKISPVIRQFCFPKIKMIFELFSFGKWLTISKALLTVLTHIDRFLIGSLISVAVIGFYTTPLDTVARALVLPESLKVLFPVFSTFGKERKKEASFFYTRSLKHLLIIMGGAMLLVAFLAPQILFFWLGQEFLEKSTLVLRLLAVGIFAFSFSLLGENVIKGFGRPDILAKIRLLEVLFVIFALWFFIINFGINGAALVWMVWALIDALFINFVALKLLSLNYWDFIQGGLNRAFLAFFAFASALFLGKLFLPIVIFFIFVLLLIISFIFIWRYYILDNKDVGFLKSILPIKIKTKK